MINWRIFGIPLPMIPSHNIECSGNIGPKNEQTNRPTAKPRRVLRGGLLMTWLQGVKDEPWFSGGVVSSAKWGFLIQVFEINPYSFVSCLSFTMDFPIQACPAGGFRYSLFKESRPQWLWKQKLMSWKHGSTIWRWLSWLSWLPLLVQQSWVGVVVFPTFRGRFVQEEKIDINWHQSMGVGNLATMRGM